MIALCLVLKATPFLGLYLRNGRDVVEFSSAAGAKFVYSAPKDRHVMDFCLLTRQGLSTIELDAGTLIVWNPVAGSQKEVFDMYSLLVVGAKNSSDPVVIRRFGPDRWQLHTVGPQKNELHPYGYEQPFNVLLQSIWFPNRSAPLPEWSREFDAFGYYDPRVREKWLSDGVTMTHLEWKNHEVDWEGKLCLQVNAKTQLITISGSNEIGTVSLVSNENPNLRSWPGHRDYWTDVGEHKTESRERYETVMINMRTGKTIGKIANAARVELCRQ